MLSTWGLGGGGGSHSLSVGHFIYPLSLDSIYKYILFHFNRKIKRNTQSIASSFITFFFFFFFFFFKWQKKGLAMNL